MTKTSQMGGENYTVNSCCCLSMTIISPSRDQLDFDEVRAFPNYQSGAHCKDLMLGIGDKNHHE